MAPSEQRILLVRLSHLGDVVHALPVYHALRERFPDARMAWVVQREYAPLIEPLPGLERVVTFDRRGGAHAWPRLARELSTFGATLVVDAQANLKSAAASLCAGPARRTGLAARDWREPLGATVLHDAAPPVGPRRKHALDRMLALARYVTGAALEPRYDPALDSEELAAGKAELDALAGRADAPVLLHLSHEDDVRSWPTRSFEELARALAPRRVVVLSGPAEQDAGTTLRERTADLAHVRSWVGQRGLRELAALFAAAARRDGRLVACDSGPLHLAASVGLPVVALEGPQSHQHTGPWPLATSRSSAAADGGPHQFVRAAAEPACAPCFARRCVHENGPVCMTGIEPEQVALGLLADESGPREASEPPRTGTPTC